MFCDKYWGKIVTTTKKGHLSSKQLAKGSSTTLCPRVPKHVSDFFTDQLSKLKQRKAEQVARHVSMESRLGYEKTSTDFGVKRLRQTIVDETIDYKAIALAGRKVVRCTTCTKQSFHSCEHDSCKEMISAASKAGPSYVGPTEYMVRTSLLSDEYEAAKSRSEKRMSKHSLAGRLMTIVSDACTTHKQPLTNYVAKYTNEPGTLLKYEDATTLYQSDGIKDAETVASGISAVIEEVGERSAAAVD